MAFSRAGSPLRRSSSGPSRQKSKKRWMKRVGDSAIASDSSVRPVLAGERLALANRGESGRAQPLQPVPRGWFVRSNPWFRAHERPEPGLWKDFSDRTGKRAVESRPSGCCIEVNFFDRARRDLELVGVARMMSTVGSLSTEFSWRSNRSSCLLVVRILGLAGGTREVARGR